MSFWFDPTLKKSTVDSTVVGNRFLNKYWQVGVNDKPMGTSIDPETVFDKSNFDSIVDNLQSNISNSNGNTQTYGVFDGYLNHDFSNVGVNVNPPVQFGNKTYSSAQDVAADFKNSISSSSTSSTSNTQTYGVFDGYLNKDFSNVGVSQNGNETYGVFDGYLNKDFSSAGSNTGKMYLGNGLWATGYDDIINNLKNNIGTN